VADYTDKQTLTDSNITQTQRQTDTKPLDTQCKQLTRTQTYITYSNN